MQRMQCARENKMTQKELHKAMVEHIEIYMKDWHLKLEYQIFYGEKWELHWDLQKMDKSSKRYFLLKKRILLMR